MSSLSQWTTPQVVTSILGTIGLTSGSAGLLHYRLTRKGKRLDVAAQVEELAGRALARESARADRLEVTVAGLQAQITALMAWIVMDNDWHTQVMDLLKAHGIDEAPEPPALPNMHIDLSDPSKHHRS